MQISFSFRAKITILIVKGVMIVFKLITKMFKPFGNKKSIVKEFLGNPDDFNINIHTEDNAIIVKIERKQE